MSLLSYNELMQLIESRVIENVDPEQVNSTSIDITLGDTLQIETRPPHEMPFYTLLSLADRTPLRTRTQKISPQLGYDIHSQEYVLAHSREVFNLPNNISAEYKLKSSMARIGLEHLNAGWCDAGWHGSVLTLELINLTRYHRINIKPGDRIGQVVFFRHEPVPDDKHYGARGRYNNDKSVHGCKA